MFLTRRVIQRLPQQVTVIYRHPFVFRRRNFSVSRRVHQITEEAVEVEQTTPLNDGPIFFDDHTTQVDWSRSFHGLSTKAFSEDATKILTAPVDPNDVEIKPGSLCSDLAANADGIIYLPEIKYRRILNKAFGPGGWGLAPRSETTVTPKSVSREYALVCHGRLVSVARGEQDYFDPDGVATATEGCKSNALMRCCKDLGIASELWYVLFWWVRLIIRDPRFIRKFKKEYCVEAFTEHVLTKKIRKLWRRKDDVFEYPYKEKKPFVGTP